MSPMLAALRRTLAVVCVACLTLSAALCAHAADALSPEIVRDLALGENDAKVKAMATLVASGSASALALLQSLQKGEIQTAGDTVLQMKDGAAIDLVTGKKVD